MLIPLPRDPFPFFHEARRKVHRDGHVAILSAYYSAPPEYVGRTVWVRWDDRIVRVFNNRFRQIAIHPRREPGCFETHPSHIHPEKISIIEKGAEYLLRKVGMVGPYSAAWSQALIQRRGVTALRTLQGYLSLTQRHSSTELERACRIAHDHEAFRLKHIRRLLKNKEAPEQQSFLEEHPLIRDLSVYDNFIHDALTRKETR